MCNGIQFHPHMTNEPPATRKCNFIYFQLQNQYALGRKEQVGIEPTYRPHVHVKHTSSVFLNDLDTFSAPKSVFLWGEKGKGRY